MKISISQYERSEHQCAVVDDILDNWTTLSHGGKFHAIFATSSIPEAIEYYKLFKLRSELNVTALFDPSIDNNGTAIFKEEAIVEILDNYNACYNKDFRMATYAAFKKDVSYRLAHKEHYKGIENTSGQQLDLLIVVDQMLTGFDSKWINTLYLDKVLVYEKLIQARFQEQIVCMAPLKSLLEQFDITASLTQCREILKKHSNFIRETSLSRTVADKLEYNLGKMNDLFADIEAIFRGAGIENFEKSPDDRSERGQFAQKVQALQ